MSRTLILACLSFALNSAVTAQTQPAAHPVQRALAFVANQGQAPADVLWEARGNGFSVSFRRESFVLDVFPAGPGSKKVEQKISLAGSSSEARIEPLDPLPGKFSFFAGSDPSRWVRGLSTYSRLRYTNIYPGIDLLFYGNHGKLEYDFVVSPGADPGQIRLRVDGTPHVTERGELQLGEASESTLHRPVLYQNIEGGKKMIEGRFITRDGQAGFQYGRYDRSKPLVIDPTINLLYATYLGGLHNDQAYAIALDSQNNSYILGESASQDYPVSANAYQTERTDIGTYSYNIVVSEFTPSGILLYSTFLGLGTGVTSGVEHPSAITVDPLGNAWIAGTISSNNADGLPVTANAYQSTFPMGGQASMFFSEISPDGSSLPYSSYFAGPGGVTLSPPNTPSLVSAKIAVDQNEHVFLAGEAGSGLPTTAGAYLGSIPSGQYAPFVAAFDTTQAPAKQLLAASYLGPASPVLPYVGVNPSSFTEMVLDSSGNPWMLGSTYASNFPTTSNAIQPSITLAPCNAPGDPLDRAAFVAKLSADLKTLMYGSFLSGKVSGANPSSYCVEFPTSATLDGSGNLYVAGVTTSNKFPTTAGVFDQTATVKEVGYWQFLAKISSNGSEIDWATYFGQGGGDGSGPFVGVDGQLNVWIADDDPLTPTTSNALQQTLNPSMIDEAVAELSSDGTKLLYATFLPQLATQYPYPNDTVRSFAVDPLGNTYFTGWTGAGVIPVTPNAFQSQFANGDLNPDENDAFFMMLGGGAISGIGPTTGGNSGDTTVTINGSGFEQGATCSLVEGGTIIPAASVSVTNGGATVNCTFALAGATAGTYDVAVSNPDGSGSTDKSAFTVASGGQPNVWTSIGGRSEIRVGTPSQVLLNYGNNGNVNAYMTTIWLVLPAAYTYSITGLTAPNDPNCPLLNSTPIALPQGNFNYIPLVVPVIPAGYSNSIVVTVTAPAVANAQELIAYAESPWFDSISSANQVLTAAITSPGTVPAACVTSTSDPAIADCLGPMSAEVKAITLADLNVAVENDPNLANDTTVQLATTLQNWANVSANVGQTVIPALVLFAQTGADLLCRLYNTCNACALPNFPNLVEGVSPPSKPAPWVLTCPDDDSELGFGADFLDGSSPCFPQGDGDSIDPNDKTGPNGDGSSSRYVQAGSPFTYTVSFENEASATLPAGQVVVTDPLDSTKVDLTTLSLGKISFGTNLINIPANSSSFNTLFPVNSSLSVRIQGSLNPDTNTLKWTFISIDPSTGLPPSDPSVGFLPPDTNGVEGQGSVTFSVMPKSGQATGAQITNQATVVFDTNAPIMTAAWLNTLDVTAPVSAVTALPAQEAQTAFTVSWSGSDVGSGIGTYTIYVSDNGGPYTVFQNAVTVMSASFTGQAGHTYGFYGIATDRAGNVEQAKSAADTTTTVAGETGNATTTAASNVAITFSPSAQMITLAATVVSTAGTVNAGSVTFTLLGSSVSGSVSKGAAGASFSVPAGQMAGSYTIQAVYNAAGGFEGSSDSTHLLTIGKATPVITWATPAAIEFGSALGSGQLDAAANVAGAFVYTPAAGTVLTPGNAQTLSVTFTPTDATDYDNAAGSVVINVETPPSGPVDLIVTKVLSRTSSQVQVAVTIANDGGSAAANVELTAAKIGSTAASTALPESLGSIGIGAIQQVTVAFPGSIGASGTATTLTLSGTYTGGSFSSTARITLP